MGKANVFVYDLSEGYIDEDDPAARIRQGLPQSG